MPMTNAERQRKYRQRLKSTKDDLLARLHMLVSPACVAQLSRIARHQGITKREALERIMLEAENQLVSELNQADESDYFRPFQR